MPNKINLLHRTFGRLTVVEDLGSRRTLATNVSVVFWKCICTCGRYIETTGASLRCGDTKSCGCLQQDTARNQGIKNYKGAGVAAVNSLYSKYKKKSEYRGLSFSLSKEEFRTFLFSDCHYCGCAPKGYFRRTEVNYSLKYNGLDRVNSDEGYILGNIVSCCGDCNIAKSDLTKEEFFSLIKRVYERHLNAV